MSLKCGTAHQASSLPDVNDTPRRPAALAVSPPMLISASLRREYVLVSDDKGEKREAGPPNHHDDKADSDQ